MKTIIKILFLVGFISVNAQVDPLLDHDWKLEQVVTADSTLVVPDEIITGLNFEYFEDGSYYESFFGDCQNISDNAIFDDNNQSFILEDVFFPLGNCGNTEILAIEFFLYEEFIFQDSNLEIPYNPFLYSFTTTENIIYLNITNSDGSIATYSTTTLSNESFNASQFSIYPNPSTNKLHIESEVANIKQIEIFNLMGKQVMNVVFQKDQPLDVSSLAKGIYLVKVKTENGILTKKLIKN